MSLFRVVGVLVVLGAVLAWPPLGTSGFESTFGLGVVPLSSFFHGLCFHGVE
ncbi:hypothetical protein LguiA_002480 [Lonicera macranthoides]